MSASNKAWLAEFVGLFCFTFVGAGAICTTALTHGEPGLVGIALAHGLMMAINIAALGQYSGGHFNPVVTIALWSTGRCGTAQAVRYVAAQLL
ncbi:MAG: aquaporin, partial [bacterium]